MSPVPPQAPIAIPANMPSAPVRGIEPAALNPVGVLPAAGFVRLRTILAIYPICASGWWQGVKDGRLPQGVKLSARVTAWRVEDIRALLTEVGNV